MCVALAALDAVVRVEGPVGARQIPIMEFHRLPGETPEIDIKCIWIGTVLKQAGPEVTRAVLPEVLF